MENEDRELEIHQVEVDYPYEAEFHPLSQQALDALTLIDHDLEADRERVIFDANRLNVAIREAGETHAADALNYAILGTETGRFPVNPIQNDQPLTVDRAYINDVITDRERLLPHVYIEFDQLTQSYQGYLFENRMTYDARIHNASDEVIREYMTNILISERVQAERDAMDTGTTTTSSTVWNTITYSAPPNPIPQFVLQQNTRDLELRALREQYPQQIFQRNYNQPYYLELHMERDAIRHAINVVRQTQFAQILMSQFQDKFPNEIHYYYQNRLSRRQRADLELYPDVKRHRSYREAQTMIEQYQQTRDHFLADRERFGDIQAEYNQRMLMIRQKPQISRAINVQEIVETVSQWENVWGIAAKKSAEGNLLVRVGLCDVVMSESAPESRYVNPPDILLAPFFFTLELRPNASFICSSRENSALGASRHNAGGIFYDFHPHQLSDTPCFGSFGQTFIDLLAQGDVISFLGGIIAFYSQYNSQDSAGVNARHYYPTAFLMPNMDTLRQTEILHITRWNYHSIDESKLDAAIARYTGYHEEEREADRIQMREIYICYSCDEEDVSDGTDYYLDYAANRICQSCWEDTYCRECERHHDDCVCDYEE